MKCEPHGNDPTCWNVTSESEGEMTYGVDLCGGDTYGPYAVRSENGVVYSGTCTCRHYTMVCLPEMRKSGFTVLRRCKHIRAVQEQALNMILPFFLKARAHEDFAP